MKRTYTITYDADHSVSVTIECPHAVDEAALVKVYELLAQLIAPHKSDLFDLRTTVDTPTADDRRDIMKLLRTSNPRDLSNIKLDAIEVTEEPDDDSGGKAVIGEESDGEYE